MKDFHLIMAIVLPVLQSLMFVAGTVYYVVKTVKKIVLMYAIYLAEPHYGYVESKHITRMSESFHSRSKLIL